MTIRSAIILGGRHGRRGWTPQQVGDFIIGIARYGKRTARLTTREILPSKSCDEYVSVFVDCGEETVMRLKGQRFDRIDFCGDVSECVKQQSRVCERKGRS